jgi:adenylate cyclase
MIEIERKWLVSKLPDLKWIKQKSYKRYFLFIGKTIEVRIQKVDSKYIFEVKEENNKLSSIKHVLKISKKVFEELKKTCNKFIVRDSYVIQQKPEISVKIYHRDFKGLIRVEAEFNSEIEANEFKPLSWFGTEITHTKLGKDKELVKLNKSEFNLLLKKYS